MLTSSIRSFCLGKQFPPNERSSCENVKVLPFEKCFVIPFEDFYKFYEENFQNEILDIISKKTPYFVHIWNAMLHIRNKNYSLSYNSSSAYMELAKIYCPEVAETKISF